MTLRRFAEAVTAIGESPSAVNVARYLRASAALERGSAVRQKRVGERRGTGC